MNRIAVLGCTGSGKTTLARTLAERLSLTHIELDSLYHQPGWTRLAPGELGEQALAAISAADEGWTMCGGYDSEMQAIRVSHADTIVWLDPSKRVVMFRVTKRTIRRGLTRESLWNGNKESLRNLFSLNPEKNLILWAWTTYGKRKARYSSAIRNREWDHLDVYQLTSQKAVDAFLGKHAPQP